MTDIAFVAEQLAEAGRRLCSAADALKGLPPTNDPQAAEAAEAAKAEALGLNDPEPEVAEDIPSEDDLRNVMRELAGIKNLDACGAVLIKHKFTKVSEVPEEARLAVITDAKIEIDEARDK